MKHRKKRKKRVVEKKRGRSRSDWKRSERRRSVAQVRFIVFVVLIARRRANSKEAGGRARQTSPREEETDGEVGQADRHRCLHPFISS